MPEVDGGVEQSRVGREVGRVLTDRRMCRQIGHSSRETSSPASSTWLVSQGCAAAGKTNRDDPWRPGRNAE
jgi:hypothetical protein